MRILISLLHLAEKESITVYIQLLYKNLGDYYVYCRSMTPTLRFVLQHCIAHFPPQNKLPFFFSPGLEGDFLVYFKWRYPNPVRGSRHLRGEKLQQTKHLFSGELRTAGESGSQGKAVGPCFCSTAFHTYLSVCLPRRPCSNAGVPPVIPSAARGGLINMWRIPAKRKLCGAVFVFV